MLTRWIGSSPSQQHSSTYTFTESRRAGGSIDSTTSIASVARKQMGHSSKARVTDKAVWPHRERVASGKMSLDGPWVHMASRRISWCKRKTTSIRNSDEIPDITARGLRWGDVGEIVSCTGSLHSRISGSVSSFSQSPITWSAKLVLSMLSQNRITSAMDHVVKAYSRHSLTERQAFRSLSASNLISPFEFSACWETTANLSSDRLPAKSLKVSQRTHKHV